MIDVQLPILVFGGAYGNLEALMSLHRYAQSHQIPPSQVINTGDAVAYCADPVACLDFLMKWKVHSIAGNVEIQLGDDLENCGCGFTEGTTCDVLSQQWYPYLQSQIASRHREWMKNLPRTLHLRIGSHMAAVVHGSFSHTSQYIFSSTPWLTKEQELQRAEASIVLAGHCGLPFIEIGGGKVWANAGAIGMPANDRTARTWFMIIRDDLSPDVVSGAKTDAKNLRFELQALDFDCEFARQKMLAIPALRGYADSLQSGLWPSCDVLTPAEITKRGVALSPTPVSWPLQS